jgi:hypothetical protein
MPGLREFANAHKRRSVPFVSLTNAPLQRVDKVEQDSSPSNDPETRVQVAAWLFRRNREVHHWPSGERVLTRNRSQIGRASRVVIPWPPLRASGDAIEEASGRVLYPWPFRHQ